MLNEDQIRKLIEEKDLIQNYIDLDLQLTPNGFDMTIGELFEFDEQGALDFSNSEREVPEGKEIYTQKQSPKDKYGWWELEPGAYKVKTNERFNIPHNLMGMAYPRSSLLRMGLFTQTAFWEAGFQGKAEFLLKVENPKGVKIKENARVTQIAFGEIMEVEEGYNGRYQE
ncbi:MAG: deoxyuridine 5'-triphosphate nucleotidohydrolase [Candidatus Paceibacterota bacterium]